jgi:hypothetical protein
MLETLLPFVIIYYNTAISLGVGGSSIVIASFITALSDKKISTDERKLLGVIYITLRIAMASIALMLAYVSLVAPELMPSLPFVWLMVAMLYLNAILMTKHWISPKLGPALQAATWYTLGFVVVIDAFALYTVTPLFFASLYVADIIVALTAVNAFLWYFLSYKKDAE